MDPEPTSRAEAGGSPGFRARAVGFWPGEGREDPLWHLWLPGTDRCPVAEGAGEGPGVILIAQFHPTPGLPVDGGAQGSADGAEATPPQRRHQ